MKYLKIFTNFLEIAQGLSDSTLARLFRAMLAYALNDTEPAFKGSERALWLMVRQSIDREKEAYENKVKYLKRGNGPVSKPTGPVSSQDKDEEEEKDKDEDEERAYGGKTPSEPAAACRARFRPPALEEVAAYCQERGDRVNARRFMDYYTANGWRVGKAPMKDWKAAVRSWESNGLKERAAPAREPTVGDNFRMAMEMLRQEEAKEL